MRPRCGATSARRLRTSAWLRAGGAGRQAGGRAVCQSCWEQGGRERAGVVCRPSSIGPCRPLALKLPAQKRPRPAQETCPLSQLRPAAAGLGAQSGRGRQQVTARAWPSYAPGARRPLRPSPLHRQRHPQDLGQRPQDLPVVAGVAHHLGKKGRGTAWGREGISRAASARMAMGQTREEGRWRAEWTGCISGPGSAHNCSPVFRPTIPGAYAAPIWFSGLAPAPYSSATARRAAPCRGARPASVQHQERAPAPRSWWSGCGPPC